MNIHRLKTAAASLAAAVIFTLSAALPAAAYDAPAANASSIDITGNMRYFSDPGKNGPSEKSFPVVLPENGSLTINYWSNYFGTDLMPEDRSRLWITDASGRTVWSRDGIEKGSQVFEMQLPAGSYEIVTASDTKDGRIAFELYFQPGSGAGSVSGQVTASSLIAARSGAGGHDSRILRLNGDTTLVLDHDITLEKIETLGYQDLSLTVTGTKTLWLATEETLPASLQLILRSGEIAAPSLRNYTQYGGVIYIQGGSAERFRQYGGQLNVDSTGDGLRGYFEIHSGEVYVTASGYGIHSELRSQTPAILGGEGNIYARQGAVLIERLTEETGASDNLGGRITRTAIPLRIAANVGIEIPSDPEAFRVNSSEEYLFPSSVKELAFGRNTGTGWVRDESGWWYRYEDGSCPKDGWARLGPDWYLFDNRGYMQHGWANRGGAWYYLGVPGDGDTGCMRTGDVTIDGKTYRFGLDGVCLNP